MKMQTLIIAEAGVNHNGDLQKAHELILRAHECGADIIKFQSFKSELLVSKSAQLAAYQKKDSPHASQFELLKSLELSESDHYKLKNYADEIGIEFLSSAFDSAGLLELVKMDIKRIKIPSGEITNYQYLHQAGQCRLPIIMSTGMSNDKEISRAISVLCNAGMPLNLLTILHCNTEYPTPMDDVNLKAMLRMKESHRVEVGYSDHTAGIEVPIAATALGAKVIEKHFTLDNRLPGPDHSASLEQSDMKKMVTAIRNIEKAISGTGEKNPSKSELKNRSVVRKSLHLKRSLKPGEKINANDVIPLRPGDGICPMDLNRVIGRVAKLELNEGTKLTWNLIQ